MKARVVFLVLLLITTSIPTVFFMFGLALFLSYYVQFSFKNKYINSMLKRKVTIPSVKNVTKGM